MKRSKFSDSQILTVLKQAEVPHQLNQTTSMDFMRDRCRTVEVTGCST